MRPLIAVSLLLLAVPVALPAQLCYHAHPRPACSGFVFTNFGAYAVLGSDDWGDGPFREVADWGAMTNVGPRDAVGGSIFASLDRAGLLVGLSVRYRRWLPDGGALDLAVGTPLASSSGNVLGGSIVGLARYGPNDWFAIAVRPEALRSMSVTSCGPTACTTATRYHPRVSLGLEFGWVPGALLTGLGAAATYIAFLAILAGND